MSALVIGHSQVKYFKEYLTEDNVACLCYPGYRIQDFIEEECIYDIIPSFQVIVLVAGTNDIARSTSEEVLRDMKVLCQSVHEANPEAKLIVTSIVPRGQNLFPNCLLPEEFLAEFNKKTGIINRKMNDYASEEAWLKFLSLDFNTADGGLVREYLSRDGLHLSYHGTSFFCDCLEQCIDSETRGEVVTVNCESDMCPLTFVGPNLYSEVVTSVAKRSELVTETFNFKKSAKLRKGYIDRTNRKNMSELRRKEMTFKVSVTSKSKKEQPTVNSSKSMKDSGLENKKTKVMNNRFELLKVDKLPKVIWTKEERLRSESVSKTVTVRKSVYVIETEKRFVLNTDIDNNIQKGGGLTEDAVVYSKTDRVVTYSEALDLLLHPQSDSITTEPPYRPQSGSVFVYSDDGDESRREDWKCDGYTWRNYGKNVQVIDDYSVEKSFFRICNGGKVSDKFQRHAFTLNNNYNNRTVVVYLGQESEYQGLPHGNRKRNNRTHKRTMPSVLNNIKRQEQKPQKAKAEMSDGHPKYKEGISHPRNRKQIKNAHSKQRREKKLSHDSLYGLHLLVDQLDGFILQIKTVPDLEVIVGLKDAFEEFNRLLQLKDENINIYYDTTFELGDFYVSTLAYQHIMFSETPCIPVAFMIHERKFQKCHEQFLELIKSKVPKLNSRAIAVITDREAAILNAFQNCLPLGKIHVCWNHLKRDLRFWLSKHGGTHDDKQVYEKHLKSLLHSENAELFNEKYLQLKILWSEAMVDYFENDLKDTILCKAGRWVLEETDNYNPYSGVTNNCAESINAKLKRLVEQDAKAIDEVVTYLYYLQNDDMSDIIGGFCEESEWTLKKKFLFAKIDPETVEIPPRKCHPDKIIECIKQEIKNQMNESCDTEEPDSGDDNIKLCKEGKTSNMSQNANSYPLSSQKALAISTINDNGIVLVPSMGAFMVKGSTGEKYSVTLFPKEKCNCPSTSRCFHIISAMLSIGMDIPSDSKKMNLSQLRRNARPPGSKKCGTKKGRIGDRDEDFINPAPDSEIKKKAVDKSPSVFPDPLPTPDKKFSRKGLHFEQKKANAEMLTPEKNMMSRSPKTPRSILKKRKLNEAYSVTKSKRIKFDSDDDILIEICDIQSPRSDIDLAENQEDWWVKDLGLRETDKNIISNIRPLTSVHMEAVNEICRVQFPNVSGFQLTEKVPQYSESEKRWTVCSVMSSVYGDSCAQIHHNGKDHWVLSVKHLNTIYLIDSLGTDRPEHSLLTQSLKIQLSLLYGKSSGSILKIEIPESQRQNNNFDCGVFAIAHLVEYCLTGNIDTKVIFDTKKMRRHLIKCFDKMKLSSFPKTTKSLNRRNKPSKVVTFDLHCICNLPSCVDSIVLCDMCSLVYHKNCVFPSGKDANSVFVCDSCRL